VKNAKAMLLTTTTKAPQSEKSVKLKATRRKIKKNEYKTRESSMDDTSDSAEQAPIESTTLSELNESTPNVSKPVDANFDLNANQELLVNSIKSILGDLVKKTVEEQMSLNVNQKEKEKLLSAKKVKIDNSTNEVSESTEKDEVLSAKRYKRPAYIEEPIKKYELLLIKSIDDLDELNLGKKNTVQRLLKLRSEKLDDNNNEDFRLLSK
jgi:hypothetical protein